MNYVHIFPAVAITLNLLCTKVKLDPAHWVVMPPLVLAYSAVNFVNFKFTGEAIYPYLTWQDSQSLLIVLGFSVSLPFMYVKLANGFNKLR